jgi:hypothetical protein
LNGPPTAIAARRIDSTASDELSTTLLEQTEHYCVALQTLRSPPAIEAMLCRANGP